VFILPVAAWILLVKRLDLYDKSRVMGDYQARFCERIRVKFPFPTRPRNVGNKCKSDRRADRYDNDKIKMRKVFCYI